MQDRLWAHPRQPLLTKGRELCDAKRVELRGCNRVTQQTGDPAVFMARASFAGSDFLVIPA